MNSIERTRCDDCGAKHRACPACDGRHVSVDALDGRELSPNFSEIAVFEETPTECRYRLVCWDCGWSADRVLNVETEAVDDGA